MIDMISEYTDLVDVLVQHQTDYDAGHPTITDDVYDVLMMLALSYEHRFPDHARADSPTKTVGTDLRLTKGKLPHPVRMWSLSNVYNVAELNKFLKKTKATQFVVEYKYDGLSLSLTYIRGNLAMALTRGTGITGIDVTESVRRMGNVPKTVPTDSDVLVIHGEVILTKASFENINLILDSAKEKKYTSIRSAASGILRSNNDYVDTLKFKAYETTRELKAEKKATDTSYTARIKLLDFYGFETSYLEDPIPADQVPDRIAALTLQRPELKYEIDGLCIKVDSYEDRERLGYAVKAPKFSTAFKFQPASATTIVKDVDFRVSGQGNIIPVASLEEVFIGNFKVSSATLHNLPAMKLLDVRIGDTVEVSRVADVSNQITKVITDKRPVDATPPEIPTHCPSCGSELVVQEGRKSTLVCRNTRGCKEQVVAKIKRYISPEGVQVPLSTTVIEKLFETGTMTQIPDLYAIGRYELTSIGGMSIVAATKILAAIRDARKLPFAAHLAVLGIPSISYASAVEVSEVLKSFKALKEFFNGDKGKVATMKETGVAMDLMRGLGAATVQSLAGWCHSLEGVETMRLMISHLETGK